MPTRKIPDDYRALAKEHGFQWIGPEVYNVNTKTGWKCEMGHVRRADYEHIRRGDGCPYCYGNASKTPEDYHDLAKEKGYEWVGKEFPKNCAAKTLWRCLNGHEWEGVYNNIKGGSGCPYCAGNARKTPEDYYKLAEEKRMEWIGEQQPTNVHTTTWWKCSEGHEIQRTYYQMKQNKHGCHHCRPNFRPSGVNIDQSAFSQSAFSTLLFEYKINAKRRMLVFDLTVNQFYNLTQGNCYYCGSPPNQKREACNGLYLFNGIDRVDNETGYTLSNCVTCCKRCNYAKKAMTQRDFMDMVEMIYEKHFRSEAN